jgi:uncharacterized membrane protein YeiH
MATALEQAFINSVRVAQGVKQAALAAAVATYAPNGFGVFANLGAYYAALAAADAAFWVSVNSAATTAAAAGIVSDVVPDAPQGQIYGNWASIVT